jgi:hypothetical protein
MLTKFALSRVVNTRARALSVRSIAGSRSKFVGFLDAFFCAFVAFALRGVFAFLGAFVGMARC